MIVTAGLTKTTSHKVIIPFYAFAALSFLAAATLLFRFAAAFKGHYFQPQILAITHTMALGWGTMVILGASQQLVPVMIEGKLYSNFLAYLSFALAAMGIPLLVYAFLMFNMQWPAQYGAILINAAILSFLANLTGSLLGSKSKNVHAIFVYTATLWLFATTLMGLLLIYNFTVPVFSKDSLHFLALHAHLGIAGWFLLMVMGVGSRLIPMFLISKYTHVKLLWTIYGLVNGGLLSFAFIFIYSGSGALLFIPMIAVAGAIALFAVFIYQAYKKRIRRQVDNQVRISLFSILLMAIPVGFLVIFTVMLILNRTNASLVLAYGFSIFFGWITAIIFGMTFKTLPFIVWNKVYHHRAGLGKTPNPKDLYADKVFNVMGAAYLLGFVLFIPGILISSDLLLRSASFCILLAALLYNWNVFSVIFHTPPKK
ncbi:cytochrome C oxidase subunit I [Mucilaginibacter sp.]|uniref:cytochrome C oxidase subunit I n=1 Tax=Mucilaginibacter sp. TaxID=1882438 RepID=UPI00374D55A1